MENRYAAEGIDGSGGKGDFFANGRDGFCREGRTFVDRANASDPALVCFLEGPRVSEARAVCYAAVNRCCGGRGGGSTVSDARTRCHGVRASGCDREFRNFDRNFAAPVPSLDVDIFNCLLWGIL